VGHRKQETRTVAGFRVSTCCTAVHEPLQNGNALQHNLVRGDIINIGDQADTAGVMFVGRIVKSLSVHKISLFPFCGLTFAKNVPINEKCGQKCKIDDFCRKSDKTYYILCNKAMWIYTF
jgi:hypothetical protein